MRFIGNLGPVECSGYSTIVGSNVSAKGWGLNARKLLYEKCGEWISFGQTRAGDKTIKPAGLFALFSQRGLA